VARWAALVVSCSTAFACAKERERELASDCPSWREEIAPLVTARCTSCHSGPEAEGQYDLESYLGALGSGTDERSNAIAGDDTSRIIEALEEEIHFNFSDARPMIESWVDDCELSYFRSSFHTGGIMNPSSDDFHGELIARVSFDLAACARCHGEDFAGGKAGSSCLGCHPEGPTSCATCHGDGPASGAHRAHLSTRISRAIGCEACHVVPADYRDPGHLDPPPAELRIGVGGAYALEGARCTNVYCHGASEPSWYDEGGRGCGACHGAPPLDHADPSPESCGNCHASTRAGQIARPERHIDGKVDLGTGGSGCDGCHDLPPPSGAHLSHAEAPRRLSAPVGCTACHVMPSALHDLGHIDSPAPAEVFPEAIARTSTAFFGAAQPIWDRAASTCREAYCHGGGPLFSDESSPGIVRAPVWTSSASSSLYCGSCHGVPPIDDAHQPDWTLRDCSRCHGSVDASGYPIVTGPSEAKTSRHINGRVDG
jgi:predicted CxxxxCH...CXXCH cytochrome family protein